MDLNGLFLTAGIFMGWSLGANDAANIFGTAVGTKMIKFRTAAIVCSVFVVLGATFGGAGTSKTLESLGSISMSASAFIVSISAAITVALMSKKGLPVSTSQAIVGAIIGYNLFLNQKTDVHVLTKITGTWVFTPLLAAFFSMSIYWVFRLYLDRSKFNIIERDRYTRYGLVLAGAFGAYSLGANNIANVMGVFIQAKPLGLNARELFFIGGLSIALGVVTYSKRVMLTVGKSVFKLSPVSAFIVVLSSALVLFVFSSEGLGSILNAMNLPSVPLVPVSQSQAVVGAIMGIGLAKGGRNINYGLLGKIAVGWVLTPILSIGICWMLLKVSSQL